MLWDGREKCCGKDERDVWWEMSEKFWEKRARKVWWEIQDRGEKWGGEEETDLR